MSQLVRIVKVNSVLNAPTSELEKSGKIKRKVIFNDEGVKNTSTFLREISDCADNCLVVAHYSQ